LKKTRLKQFVYKHRLTDTYQLSVSSFMGNPPRSYIIFRKYATELARELVA